MPKSRLMSRWQAGMYERAVAAAERRWLAAARRDLLGGLAGKVLEIGAGSGLNFAHYPPQAQVTAIEPNPNFHEKAKERLATAPATIKLEQADAQHLPFADNSFDAVVATLVFCSIPNPLRAFQEARRVAKTGVPLLLIEHVQAQDGCRRAAQNLWNPCQRVLAGGCNVNRDTAAIVKAAGFQVSEARWLESEAFGLLPHLLIRAVNVK